MVLLSEQFHNYLSNRCIVPLVPPHLENLDDLPVEDAQKKVSNEFINVSLGNVQGDICWLFSRSVTLFIFFTIHDVAKFRNALKLFHPTTMFDVLYYLHKISKAKAASPNQWSRVDLIHTQIAFSRAGLNFLSIRERIQDPIFDRHSMRRDKDELGDSCDWAPVFDSGTIHGVITIAASDAQLCEKRSHELHQIFDPSVVDTVIIRGQTRQRPNHHREHFGFRDGISQPALRGLVKPYPGQIEVDPGVIIMGHKGDPVLDNPSLPQRPSWTKDGSIMVFRQLEQDVPGFLEYLKGNGKRWHEWNLNDIHLTDEQGAALFGARLIGRWFSGAPLVKTPYFDDPEMGEDFSRNNDFDFTIPGQTGPSDKLCPFTAHIRKTVPRNLDPYIQRKYLESSMIMRASIPYGPEVGCGAGPRGLLFICYQSSLEHGFFRQQVAFSAGSNFPITSIPPPRHGQDPITGGPTPIILAEAKLVKGRVRDNSDAILIVQGVKGQDAQVAGSTKIGSSIQPPPEEKFFVTSRGGEYFFVPAVSVLRRLAEGMMNDEHDA